MTTPTDDELIAFATDEQFLLFCDQDEFIDIVRAALAKWGQPQAVAGGEPVGKCCYGGSTPKSACASCAAWAPPPQAVREALAAETIMKIVMDVEQQHHFLRGTTNWAVAVGRAIESAHGIKGDSHA